MFFCQPVLRLIKIHKYLAQRVVNLASTVDAMIQNFEKTFQDLKITLILESSLQTAIASFRILRILQKVENIGKECEVYIRNLLNIFCCRKHDVYRWAQTS